MIDCQREAAGALAYFESCDDVMLLHRLVGDSPRALRSRS
jgi:hypothetical protein